MKVLVALTILQIATRIACIPTTSYVISSYSNVRLQQPSMDSLTPSVESRMANDMAMIIPLDDVTETAKVIEKVESEIVNNDKFAGIEILESSTLRNGAKGKEEELLGDGAKEIIEEEIKSLIMINDKEEITTELPTTTVSELQDDNQPTTIKPE